jgi:bacteriocin-like protein
MMTREQLVGRTLTEKELEQVSGGSGPPSLLGEGAFGTAFVASGGKSTASDDGLNKAASHTSGLIPGNFPGAGKITAGK